MLCQFTILHRIIVFELEFARTIPNSIGRGRGDLVVRQGLKASELRLKTKVERQKTKVERQKTKDKSKKAKDKSRNVKVKRGKAKVTLTLNSPNSCF